MVHRINPKMKIMNSKTRMEMHKNAKKRNEIQKFNVHKFNIHMEQAQCKTLNEKIYLEWNLLIKVYIIKHNAISIAHSLEKFNSLFLHWLFLHYKHHNLSKHLKSIPIKNFSMWIAFKF